MAFEAIKEFFSIGSKTESTSSKKSKKTSKTKTSKADKTSKSKSTKKTKKTKTEKIKEKKAVSQKAENDLQTFDEDDSKSSKKTNVIKKGEEGKKEQELVVNNLKKEVEAKKKELEDTKSNRGWFSKATNAVKEAFGFGDKKKEEEIKSLETQVKSLEENPDEIEKVYKTVMKKDLTENDLDSMKQAQELNSKLDKGTKDVIVKELESQLKEVENDFNKAKNENGWISGTWDKFKNWSGIGASSNKTQTEINNAKEQLEKLKSDPEALPEVYKSITGKELDNEEFEKFATGESTLENNSKASESVNKYSEGQKMATDVVADIASGIAAVGCVALAPVTGGASLALAAGVGAGVKTALKASDCIGNDKQYGLKDLGYDVVTGSINGLIAPISNGLGGAAGTSVAKAAGLDALESTAKSALAQAGKQAGKEIIEDTVEGAAKQAGKGLLKQILAKQGTEYVLKEGAQATFKTTLGKIAAYGTDMLVDGTLSGAADGFARSLGTGDFENMGENIFQGAIGGAIMSPIIGGGFRVVGKGAKAGLNALNNSKTMQNLFGTSFSDAVIKQGSVGDCALLSVLDGITDNSKAAKSMAKSITTTADGNYNVKIGDKIVTVAKDALSDEALSDSNGIRLIEAAYKQVAGDNALNGGYADKVAEAFGLNPVHITSDSITDEMLDKISKEGDNTILALGLKIDEGGALNPNGKIQHYYSIKGVDPDTKTITVADTYDTSQTFKLSYDDVKESGVSIDGGTIKETSLPNTARSADDELLYGVNSAQYAYDVEYRDYLRERLEPQIFDIEEDTKNMNAYLKSAEELEKEAAKQKGVAKELQDMGLRNVIVRKDNIITGERLINLGDKDVAKCEKAIKLLKQNGYDTVISLKHDFDTHTVAKNYEEFCAKYGIKYEGKHSALLETGLDFGGHTSLEMIEDVEATEEFVEYFTKIADTINSGKKVYMGCEGGTVRTSECLYYLSALVDGIDIGKYKPQESDIEIWEYLHNFKKSNAS